MFPESGPARLVALELDGPPQLLELKRRLAQRLSRDPRRDSADQFRPHITLLRFGVEGVARLVRPVSLPAFEVGEIVLFRSVLKSSGVEHSEVMRSPLTGIPPNPS